MQFVPPVRFGAQATWIALNLLYAMVCACWAAFHWGPLWGARDESLRWSVSLTIMGTLIFFAEYSAKRFDASVSRQQFTDGGLVWFLMGLVALTILMLLLFLCLLGAAIGAYVGRKGNSHRVALRGVQVGVLALLVSVGGLLWNRDNLASDAHWIFWLAVGLSFPLAIRFYGELAKRLSISQTPAWKSLRRVWERSLVWHIRFGRSARVIDFRGATLGIMVAVLLLRLPGTVVAPLQSQAFTTLVRVRAALLSQLNPEIVFSIWGEKSSGGTMESSPRQKIVILQIDEATRFAISRRSEASVQADMIALLRKYQPACIVLPMPDLYGRAYPRHSSPQFPAPDDQDIEHNRWDTRHLASIIRDTPNVVLAFPPDARLDDAKIGLLLHSTPLCGTTELPVSRSTCLPMVASHWKDQHKPPLPATIFALLAASPRQDSTPGSSRAVAFAGGNDLIQLPRVATPHMTPEGVTINFFDGEPQRDFRHLTYSALIANTGLPIALPTVPKASSSGSASSKDDAGSSAQKEASAPNETDGAGSSAQNEVSAPDGPDKPEPNPFATKTTDTKTIDTKKTARKTTNIQWIKAADLIRGKIVYLDALAQPQQLTPIGTLTQSEEQAYALTTLFSTEAFNRASKPTEAILVLSLGLLVGLICALKEPIDAILQVTVPLFLTLLVCMLAFLGGIWLDPVLPVLTILMTLTLATQMRFAHERDDRRRTSQLFGRFVAPHKVQEWLAQSPEDLGLGGKREEICVLFADVRNFTPFAEGHDATEVIDVINAYMTAITDALHAYNGILDKYTGDGLMAFFYVRPIGRAADKGKKNGERNRRKEIDEASAGEAEELARVRREGVGRAVRAALAMRDAAEALSRERVRYNRTVLHLGFSLHYGEAVVGLVGNIRQQINYTALGHTVVVAARLQTLAGGGEVVVSEEVYHETSADFDYLEGDPVILKGISTPVHPYRVQGTRSHAERPGIAP